LRIDISQESSFPGLADLSIGSDVGVLGIDLSNRRRNRMHGRVARVCDSQLDIEVIQSYGNCPKYINTRVISEQRQDNKKPYIAPESRDSLSAKDRMLIEQSGTFFIASAYNGGTGADYEGADVSHRGGKPGFVFVNDEHTLTVPDYIGNNMFNTLGNLLLNPRAGILFIDFENGDLLKLHAAAEIIHTQSEVAQFSGAQRLLRLSIDRVAFVRGGTSLRWRSVENSQFYP